MTSVQRTKRGELTQRGHVLVARAVGDDGQSGMPPAVHWWPAYGHEGLSKNTNHAWAGRDMGHELHSLMMTSAEWHSCPEGQHTGSPQPQGVPHCPYTMHPQEWDG